MTQESKPSKGKYEVVPYNLHWPQWYLDESFQLKKILSNILLDIHHVGSTAVPNLSAKAIIDILIVVKDILAVDAYNEALHKINYEPRGEYGILGRRYFVKKLGNQHTHHIHVYQANHSEINNLLAFRDFLITHPEQAKSYQDLKIQLSQKYANDGTAYREGKDKFIKNRIEEALQKQ